MLLVDTSVWIEHLRGTNSRAARTMTELLDDRETLTTTEPIAMELLAGATSARGLAQLERLVAGLSMLPLDPGRDYCDAAAIFRATRSAGRTVRRLNDCLIAQVALRNDVTLVHRDDRTLRPAPHPAAARLSLLAESSG
jgi:predicted nucleic acid-binding protein